MDTLWQDLKFGWRTLTKNPGFTAIAVLTLALGIGANTAIFSVTNSVLLQPLPFNEPDRLVQLWETETAPGNFPLNGEDYLDWQAQNHTLEASSLYSWPRDLSVSTGGLPEPAAVINTQANFFQVMGVSPALGRTFAADEGEPGKNRVAVLSNGFWKRRFGGREDAVGKAFELNGENFTVIGVMPAGFNFPPANIWKPLDMNRKELGSRGNHRWRAIARVKSGTTIAEARADLLAISQRLEKEYPKENEKVHAVVVPLKQQLTNSTKSRLWTLLGAVALVLLVACANVANLLLARATGRQRELAVRAAMGAGRGRLVQQFLTESVLLSLAGAALGMMAATWGVTLLESGRLIPIPQSIPVRLDAYVLAFNVGVAIFVGLLFGLAPALQARGLNLSEELKSSAQAVLGGSSRRRLVRDALVVGEVALSLALLVGAGLLLRSFARLRTADIGVDTNNVLTARISLPAIKYKEAAAQRQFYQGLVERVERLPGVQSAAMSNFLPLEGGNNGYITVEGNTDPAVANQLVEWGYMTSDYFRVFKIPLLAGREFAPEDFDRAAATVQKLTELFESAKGQVKVPPELSFVAIVNRTMAETFWPKQDPIGKVFKTDELRVTVIGVVGDAKQWGIRQKAIPQAFYPFTAGLGDSGLVGALVVRTSVPPANMLGAVRGSLRDLDSSLALFSPRTMDEVIADNMQGTTSQTILLGSFAALGLLLAAVGIYGVMAYLVTQRTHEIGVRMALGAQRGDVVRLVLAHGTKLTLTGIVLGIGAAAGLTRVLKAELYGVTSGDPLTYAGVSAVLMIVAMAACYVPVRRAMRVEPVVALRYE